jgi:serine/threonine protein kinase
MLGSISRIAAGGQGVVYTAPGVKMPYADALVFKEYKSATSANLDISALEAMPRYLQMLSFDDGMELISRAAWPCRLVEEAGVVQGFVMPAIPDKFFLTMQKASGPTRVPGEFQHLLNDPNFLARRHIVISDRNRYELLGELAKALEIFHSHKIAVGDLSPKNLLYVANPHASVYFIDCDAMRLNGVSVLPQLETPGWEVRAISPGEELATPASDCYKLGLLALRLLAGDQSSRDVSRLPASVPNAIRQLITEALSPRSGVRPSPADWNSHLHSAGLNASTQAVAGPATVPKTTPQGTRVRSQPVVSATTRAGAPRSSPSSGSSGPRGSLSQQQAQPAAALRARCCAWMKFALYFGFFAQVVQRIIARRYLGYDFVFFGWYPFDWIVLVLSVGMLGAALYLGRVGVSKIEISRYTSLIIGAMAGALLLVVAEILGLELYLSGGDTLIMYPSMLITAVAAILLRRANRTA